MSSPGCGSVATVGRIGVGSRKLGGDSEVREGLNPVKMWYTFAPIVPGRKPLIFVPSAKSTKFSLSLKFAQFVVPNGQLSFKGEGNSSLTQDSGPKQSSAPTTTTTPAENTFLRYDW